jgi:hypothetical protein
VSDRFQYIGAAGPAAKRQDGGQAVTPCENALMGDFTLEMAIIAAVRVAGSLFVLRWALVGAIIAILVDLSDLFLMNLLDLGGVHNYQGFDKLLDQVYMAAFLVVALRWTGTARNVAVGLYLFRLVGFFVFEVTDQRALLVFPNVFEFWFVLSAGYLHWRPAHAFSRRSAAAWLAALTVLKEFQEYALHVGRWLDGFTAVEAVQAIWDTATAPFR